MEKIKNNWGWILLAAVYVIGWFVVRSLYGMEAPSGEEITKFDITMLWVMSPIVVPFIAIYWLVTFGL